MNKISGTIQIKDIENCQVGDQVAVNATVKTIRQVDTAGKNYNQTLVTIEDRTGETTINMWKTLEQVEQDLLTGLMYNIHGSIGQFRDQNQLNYNMSNIIEDTKENRMKYDPNASRGITEEQEKVFHIVINQLIEDDRYRRLCQVAFGLGDVPQGLDEEEYRGRLDRFKKAWCSLNHHDNYAGGLFNHSVGMARIITNLKRQYDNPMGRYETVCDINWDHLYTLALLHDYDKQEEYVKDSQGNMMYNPNIKIGHVISGATRITLLHTEVEEDLKLTNEELENLRYGILCHHGKYDNFEAKSLEDKILHNIDMLDACFVDALRLE